MQNPWLDLPSKPPYVLPGDRLAVEVFNRSTARKYLKIDLRLRPDPFLGRPDAEIVVLALNPGLSDHDAASHRRPAFQQRLLSCLRHDTVEYPFYYLDPAEGGPGTKWWCRTVGKLIENTSREALARELSCLEFFPYHSRAFGHAHVRLPSQLYTFELLRGAIHRGAVILLTRGESLWQGAVPELAGYTNCFRVKSWRSASISPGNCARGYAAALQRLRAGGGAQQVRRSRDAPEPVRSTRSA